VSGPTGRITEIFSSLQGEGTRLGERMIFVRLAGCPWRCDYCDTPGSLAAAGAKEFSVEDVLDEVHHLLEDRPQETVSLTGGEPLAQTAFLKALMGALRRLGLRTYLETSGTHPDLLRRVIDETDVVSMDVKLPSSVGRAFWEEHAAFLKAAAGKAFLKVVLTEKTTDEEMERALRLAASVLPAPALILQPVTPVAPLADRLAARAVAARVLPPPPARVAAWWEQARRRLPAVKVIPQMHPLWGVP
jgi:organic radical activating enzyme